MLNWLLLLQLALTFDFGKSIVAPILDIENETLGYLGSIGERNVLVDLKPHLQIKNIDAINGICSYHVFKPNSEEFPFTIDIKDKTTGEAVIEVIRKDIDSDEDASKATKKIKILDCNKRKEFNFLIQAHDCSSPTLASNKVPVRIQVVDHDDSVLKFENDGLYKKTLVESELIYEEFLSVRARDEDCTNDGYACLYKLLNSKDFAGLDDQNAFKIDSKTGKLSSTRALRAGEKFNLKVRAFDCLNNESFVDADVNIDIVERCLPEWTNYPVEILSTLEATNVFDGIKKTSCEKSTITSNQDGQCQVENVDAVVSLLLDPKIQQENCQKKCAPKPMPTVQIVKNTIFSADKNSLSSLADDNIEDDEDPVAVSDDDETNKVVQASLTVNSNIGEISSSNEQTSTRQTPTKYISFSKAAQNAKLIAETPKFNDQFTLSAWLRRPPVADKNIKEHVLCGTDSKTMNRHHFGLYFYRGNIKFLLRREHQAKNPDSGAAVDSSDNFYPSLWEWQLSEALLTDSKWHFYEVKFSYPNASLYIDNVKFLETASNSDIIDAYELSDVTDAAGITTYVGACYHARTQSLIDFFEGDIASLELNNEVKNTQPENLESQCHETCTEIVQINSDKIDSILSVERKNEIKLKAKNLDDMAELIKKVAYVNKETYPKQGLRSIKLTTALKCSNGKPMEMKEAQIKIQVKSLQKDFVVKINGEKQLFVTKQDLENGIEPFKDISIVKTAVSKESSEEYSGEQGFTPLSETKLSKCQIRISPERNLMTPGQNNEKIMFLQNLLDDYALKFEESTEFVSISGVQSVENYEAFLRRLTYVILNIGDVEAASLSLIKNKKFFLSCTRIESNLETNVILVQVNLTQESSASGVAQAIAYRQAQKYVVADGSEENSKDRLDLLSSNSEKEASTTNPLLVGLIVLVACAFGFILVFAAIKIHTSKILFRHKRKSLVNEENPQMEWDDSGLNITENPLDTLEVKERGVGVVNRLQDNEDEDEFISSDDEEDDQESNIDEREGGEIENHVLYSSEEDENIEEEEPGRVTNLEWDDMNIDIVKREKQLQKMHLAGNKIASNYITQNKFV